MRFSRVLVGVALVVGMVAVVVGLVGCAGCANPQIAQMAQMNKSESWAREGAKIAKEKPGVDAVTSGSCVGGVCLLGDVR